MDKQSATITQEKEFESKSLLSADDFDRLVRYYEILPSDFFSQRNLYLDTASLVFKRHDCALRFRERNEKFELTLKAKQSDAHLERTISLDSKIAHMLTEQLDQQGHWAVKGDLLDLFRGFSPLEGKSMARVYAVADLVTWRAEIPIEKGLIMLDRSIFYGQTDFEIEVEAHSAPCAQSLLADILSNLGITHQKSQPKIARALSAKHNNCKNL